MSVSKCSIPRPCAVKCSMPVRYCNVALREPALLSSCVERCAFESWQIDPITWRITVQFSDKWAQYIIRPGRKPLYSSFYSSSLIVRGLGFVLLFASWQFSSYYCLIVTTGELLSGSGCINKLICIILIISFILCLLCTCSGPVISIHY